jgi:Rps23 Pro-64 3,4-dihydroxylase Tpa1-like proline 4-hydroxylase
MLLSDVINEKWIDAKSLSAQYSDAWPFPHIVIHHFIKEDVLRRVLNEFPDLSKLKDSAIYYNNNKEIKLASSGMQALSSAALELTTYLQSDLMMNWLNDLTGIDEPLISDPYLSGGGYHEIRRGGFLKVHADFNKHPKLDLDRRLNLLIYLNEDWKDEWGGALQLFDKNIEKAIQTVYPRFNTAVIFTTTSYTFHGHPDPLDCPKNRSRKSLAYYYFSTGRPQNEVSADKHSTLFKERKNETFKSERNIRSIIRDITPPIFVKAAKYLLRK